MKGSTCTTTSLSFTPAMRAIHCIAAKASSSESSFSVTLPAEKADTTSSAGSAFAIQGR